MTESAHTLSLEDISAGWPHWKLNCHHGPDDPQWICREENGEPDPLGAGECVLSGWWEEVGIEMVDITNEVLFLPIPLHATWHGDSWTLSDSR